MKRITINAGERTLSQLEAIKERGVYLDYGTAIRAAIEHFAKKQGVVETRDELAPATDQKRKPSPLAVPVFAAMTDQAILAWLDLQGFIPSERRVANDSPLYSCVWRIEDRVLSDGRKFRGLVEERFIGEKRAGEDFTPLDLLASQVKTILNERAEKLAELAP